MDHGILTTRETSGGRLVLGAQPPWSGRGLVRRLLLLGALVLAARSAAQPLQYAGGRVLASPQVVVVLWGDRVRSSLPPEVQSFYEVAPSLGHWDWLSQYDTPTQRIGRGTFLGTFEITPGTTKTVLSGRQVAREVVAQVNAGKLPAASADSYYAVYLPDEITIQDPGEIKFCDFALAYHDSLFHTGLPGTFGLFPSCGRDAAVAFHELFEATTDPYGSGWWSPEGMEIADLCQDFQTSLVLPDGGSIPLQKLWSNRLDRCAASDAEFQVTLSPIGTQARPNASFALSAEGPGITPDQVSWTVEVAGDDTYELIHTPAGSGWTLTLHPPTFEAYGFAVEARAGGRVASGFGLVPQGTFPVPDAGIAGTPPRPAIAVTSQSAGGCSHGGDAPLPLLVATVAAALVRRRPRLRNASSGMLLRSSPP